MGKSKQSDIESIIRLFDESEWKEIHVKTDSLELFISTDPNSRIANTVQKLEKMVVPGRSESISEQTDSSPSRTVRVNKNDIPDGMVGIVAPNLGTFYRRPKPEANPYVEIGDDVTESTEVCLIEVMKLFTPVKAGLSGRVKNILVSDGDMVEFEQPLIIIEPLDSLAQALDRDDD